jgi:glycosyltransferase involved in cell wall biosynthesis
MQTWKTDVSTIICTHNPRPDYLRRVLDALKAQTLPQEQWELLLIDNASKETLAAAWDLNWHPNARHIREDEPGLTPARLRGIKESVGELLVFVDDDNVLNPSYLETALSLAKRLQHIGAFSGSTRGECEIPVPDYLKPYVKELSDFALDQDYWSNLPCKSVATPIGAGLCVRRQVAEDYALKSRNTPLRKQLDRCGNVLLSGGDLDLAWCAIDAGMGTGRFKNLRLVHLVPKRRITEEYIIRLYAGYASSREILAAIRPAFFRRPNVAWKAALRFLADYIRVSKMQRKIMVASSKARREARQVIQAALPQQAARAQTKLSQL